jgi:hypothetical protein
MSFGHALDEHTPGARGSRLWAGRIALEQLARPPETVLRVSPSIEDRADHLYVRF